ncbi:MAG: CNNM domain-containing protein [Planctomycetota bacterium]|jgi:CBS domain containing-hemolysin-like protein
MNLIYQIPVCILLIALGAFFSGSETGIYRLSRFRLRFGIEHKKPFYALLGKVMDDSTGLVFSMLIGNNLVHYLVTSIVTAIFLASATANHAAEFYATILMAPILFVFSEVVPKNICYHRADSLMPRLTPVLWFFHKLFTYSGAVFLLKTISRAFAAMLGLPAADAGAITAGRPGHIRQIISETHDEGILSPIQNDIMNRLIKAPNIIIASVMTPITKVEMLKAASNREQVLAQLRRCPYTRLPVYENSRNNITGFVNIYEVLRSKEEFQDLRNFVKPIARFATTTSVIDAMNKMQRQNHKIVLVVPEYARRKRPFGIVTMKDLVEELTGELAQW